MAKKLYFRYGAMNSGKSTAMLQAAYNYQERGKTPIIMKPGIDTKAGRAISSRIGMQRDVDFLLGAEDMPTEILRNANLLDATDALFIDEAQFMTPAQVDDLFVLAVQHHIPVLAYGLRADFQTKAFPGAMRLLEIAHSIEEMKTICRCGSKALFNARIIDGKFVSDGAQVAIDGEQVDYESLCGRCYIDKVGAVRFDRDQH